MQLSSVDLPTPDSPTMATNSPGSTPNVTFSKTGASPDAKAMSDLRERGIAATRQLAKRQITWLRSMPTRTVIACDAPDAVQSAVQRIAAAA